MVVVIIYGVAHGRSNLSWCTLQASHAVRSTTPPRISVLEHAQLLPAFCLLPVLFGFCSFSLKKPCWLARFSKIPTIKVCHQKWNSFLYFYVTSKQQFYIIWTLLLLHQRVQNSLQHWEQVPPVLRAHLLHTGLLLSPPASMLQRNIWILLQLQKVQVLFSVQDWTPISQPSLKSEAQVNTSCPIYNQHTLNINKT